MTSAPVLDPARPAVVIVDDDPAVANALAFSLGLEGFDVKVFRDGESLLRAKDLPRSGCLVLDFKLPDMDGLELLERLRAESVALPAILITTNPREALRRRAAEAGVAIVEKPLLTDALLDSVRIAVDLCPPA